MIKQKAALFLLLFFYVLLMSSQELNIDVVVDYSQVENSTTSVYKNLEKSLKTYLNSTAWTKEEYKDIEKINCSFVIIISERPTINSYKATLQVLSNRPVFNSTYSTPIINWQDKDFSFEYIANEQIIFNERRFSNKNLTDVLAFYIYMVLGYDADTFQQKGGTKYFEIARQIANNGESQNAFGGWKRIDGPRTRGGMIHNILLKDMEEMRRIWYDYHINGLDKMSIDQKEAKKNIYNAVLKLDKYQKKAGQYFGLDIFINGKKDEIPKIFSNGPTIGLPMRPLKDILIKINPAQAKKWNELKD